MNPHYTYIISGPAPLFGKPWMYIGVRTAPGGNPHTDDYWGSGALPADVRETHDKTVLATFPTREEALADEVDRHNVLDVGRNPEFYNEVKQTSTGFDATGRKHSQRSKDVISHSKRGKPLSMAHRAAISAAGKGAKKPQSMIDKTRAHMMGNTRSLGAKRSAATRALMSAALVGNTRTAGRKQTAEHIERKAAKLRGQTRTPEQRARISLGKRNAAKSRTDEAPLSVAAPRSPHRRIPT